MTIHYSKFPSLVNALEAANKEEKLWLGIDSKIQLPSSSDFHFFDSYQNALDFQDFNRGAQKEVLLLPVITTLDFIHEAVVARLHEGEQNPSVTLDAESILSAHEDFVFRYSVSGLSETLDSFDWTKVFYDPLEANTEAESFDDKIQFNRLEWLVEELSAFALSGDRPQTAVSELLDRYWKGQPMEVQIAEVLKGKYVQTDLSNQLNTNVMNNENLEYLKNKIRNTNFGESLYGELEKNIHAKKPEFQLHFTTEIGNKPFNATLDFRKSDTSDMYFFNRYKASIEKSNGEKIEQTFQISKGKDVTAKQAYNLLQGRAVKKELVNAKGETYQAWIQLDFDKKDERGNHFVNKYNDNYGYDLRGSVAKFPVKELDGGEKENELLRSLERGNAQAVTFDMGGTEQKFFIAANPVYKSLNVYDEKFALQKHENLPKMNRSQDVAQGQEKGVDQKQGVKKEISQKNNGTVAKKRTGQKKGMKI
ncbi:MAG: hypothetical protein ABI581_05880 [Sediminibacterium sp.]